MNKPAQQTSTPIDAGNPATYGEQLVCVRYRVTPNANAA